MSVSVRIERIEPCEHGDVGLIHNTEGGLSGGVMCPGGSRTVLSGFPPEAIEAGVRAYFEYEDDTEWEQDVALAMADPAAVRFVRGLAAAWKTLTGKDET